MLAISFLLWHPGKNTFSGWMLLSDNPQCEPYTPNRDFSKKANTPQYIYDLERQKSH